MLRHMMTLDEYLWRSKPTRSEIALLLGLSRGAVQAWLRYERDRRKGPAAWAPARKWRRKIQRVTRGAVSADNWS